MASHVSPMWLMPSSFSALSRAFHRPRQNRSSSGSPAWIDKRLRGIAIRQNLTDEWKERGITEQRDYAILTAEIAKATFGITPSEHKEIKGLTKKSQNLRDHMTDLELIFTMLGERVTTEVSQKEKPEGMRENVKVAKRGGSVAGVARKAAEKEIGHSVVSDSNFLDKNPDSILIGGVEDDLDIE